MTTQTEKRAGHTEFNSKGWHLVTENYSRDGIALNGNLPTIRATDGDTGFDIIIASLGAPKFRCEQAAHLMLHAPDLLAALERFLTLDDFGHEMTQAEYEQKKETAIQQARSAIARAKGEA